MAWRAQKLEPYPVHFDQIKIRVNDARALSQIEKQALQEKLDQYNMAVYQCTDLSENKSIPVEVGRLFGLESLDANLAAGEDAISEIQIDSTEAQARYIPYTPSKLSWHSDGYYNAMDKQIRAMSMHCVRPAKAGGENALLDPEIAYIYLRDINPKFIIALTEPDAMTIPANEVNGRIVRAAQTGPVFSFDPNGYLHMRYTARTRSIEWKASPTLNKAVAALNELLEYGNDFGLKWIIRGRLEAGEGLICNNVLHNRSAFKDDARAPRLLYRLRYYERAPTAS